MKYKINYSLKFIFFVIFYFCFLSIGANSVFAQEVGLRSYPSLIKLTSPNPAEQTANITIENLTDNSVALETQIRLFKAGSKELGDVELLDNTENPNGILQKIHIFNGENEITGLTLGPKQKRQLKIKIDLADIKEARDYYFSVIFLTKPQDFTPTEIDEKDSKNSFSTISAGVGSNIIVSIGQSTGQPNPLAIEEFSTSKYSQSGPLPFTLKIQNNSSNYVSPKGEVSIKNMFGQTIGNVDLPKSNILANSSRYLYTTDKSSSTPTLVWKEKFLLGFYEAKLSIQAADTDQPITRTIRFFVFPAKFLIILILCIGLILAISRRVKQKMS